MCIRTMCIVLHAPEIGAAGHVHYLELDQFIGEAYLVTVHGHISSQGSVGGGVARNGGGKSTDGQRPAASYLGVRT